jgi:hypothetical protein
VTGGFDGDNWIYLIEVACDTPGFRAPAPGVSIGPFAHPCAAASVQNVNGNGTRDAPPQLSNSPFLLRGTLQQWASYSPRNLGLSKPMSTAADAATSVSAGGDRMHTLSRHGPASNSGCSIHLRAPDLSSKCARRRTNLRTRSYLRLWRLRPLVAWPRWAERSSCETMGTSAVSRLSESKGSLTTTTGRTCQRPDGWLTPSWVRVM